MGGSELEYIADAFATNWIAPVGPHLKKFEEMFCQLVGLKHAVALVSGTSALHLALRHLGVEPGDEVVCSSFTFCASANPIVYQGATPVLIDADRATWNLDPNLLDEDLKDSAARGRLPKAVIAVDLLGQSADMDAILEITGRYDIPVIEDAAEALGGTYKGRPAGSSGWVSAFSFNGNKIITTSGGGMLVSDEKEFIEKARFLSQQARDVAPHYEHSQIGYNYRMSNILAAIGRGQLRVLDERVAKKRWINRKYQETLGEIGGIDFMPEAPYGKSNRWLTVILITPEKFGADRETVRLFLEAENIEARPVWKPMHLQPVFQCEARGSKLRASGYSNRKISTRVVGGAVAEDLFNRGLCLPSGTALTEDDIDRITSVILGCRRK